MIGRRLVFGETMLADPSMGRSQLLGFDGKFSEPTTMVVVRAEIISLGFADGSETLKELPRPRFFINSTRRPRACPWMNGWSSVLDFAPRASPQT